jgi:MinD superfamily P-loop ATPase
MGVLEAGPTPSGVSFARGVLKIGQPMAVPVIRQLKRWGAAQNLTSRSHPFRATIMDAAPGTSCPVVETLRGADFALLVSEPTPFGLHDLRLMVEVVREMNIPAGVIVNRDMVSDGALERYCVEADLPVLMRIPLDRGIGEAIVQGQPLVAACPEYADQFRQLYAQVCHNLPGRSA